MDSFSTFLGEPTLLTSWFWTSGLQNWEDTFLLFKPTQRVMIRYSSPGKITQGAMFPREASSCQACKRCVWLPAFCEPKLMWVDGGKAWRVSVFKINTSSESSLYLVGCPHLRYMCFFLVLKPSVSPFPIKVFPVFGRWGWWRWIAQLSWVNIDPAGRFCWFFSVPIHHQCQAGWGNPRTFESQAGKSRYFSVFTPLA